MKHKLVLMGLCSGVLLGVCTVSHAITIEGVGVERSIKCNGESVEVNGTSNDLTLLGECPSLSVNGTSNSIRVELVDDISVNGMSNIVVWGGAINGDRPSIHSDGMDNKIRQGSVGSGRSSGKKKVSISGAGETLNVSTSGDDADESGSGKKKVRISGAGETLNVSSSGDEGSSGKKKTVKVSGAGETLNVNTSGSAGRKKTVSVSDGNETLNVTTAKGRGSEKQAEVSNTMASSETGAEVTSQAAEGIVINDNDVSRTVNCDGQDVVINGNDATLSLRGECDTVTVNGNRNMIRIEAARIIAVLGNQNDVLWQKGLGTKKPKISNVGKSNKISKSK